jgi:hypothetical protein
MFTSEYFAASGRDSADAMELMTKRMHQKTMSMHVVTIVTLIFLPGTFVAVSQITPSLAPWLLTPGRLSLAAAS